MAQPADAYKEHMDKGIKLYQDNNFNAAIAEFEAAYKIKPKAGPLINISLCQKGLFQYPKAIAVLEQALQKHADSMDEATKKAAQDAITEMRGLLGYVTVTLEPDYAKLTIDGEAQPDSAKKAPIPLGPGTHRLLAEAEGYASAEQSITLASGDKSAQVSLKLVPDKGFVTIRTNDPDMAIAVDQKPIGYGEWAGFLAPGAHLVQMYGEDKQLYTVQIVVAAGTTQEISPGHGGMPLSGGMAAPPPPPLPPAPAKKTEKPAPSVEGLYGLVTGSLLLPLGITRPGEKAGISPSSGGAGGVRIGYRVNNYAGFEAMFEYGNVLLSADGKNDVEYKHSAIRLGAALRLMSTGRTVRALFTLGFCGSYDRIYDVKGVAEGPAHGWGPSVLTELGVEFNIGRVLLGGGLQGYFQSTRGIDLDNTQADTEIFDTDILTVLGGGLKVGYSLW